MEPMEQQMLAGMPQRLYPCTPTRLGTWLDCPRRYRMSYLDRPPPAKGPPWAHNSFGASVHNALAGWWRLARGQRSVTAAGDLLEQGWIEEGYAGPAQSQRHRGRARGMVERYTATLDPQHEPLGVERTVGAHTSQIVISGRIDRLDSRRNPDGSRELVVVDYKTGRRELTPDDARASMALALYALAASRIFRQACRRVELHHVPTGTVHAWQHSDASVERHVRRAEGIAAECAQADERFRAGLAAGEVDSVFPPQPGPGCGWCDYRAVCPEGAAASPARRPWEGLAGESEPVAGEPVAGEPVAGEPVAGEPA
jgi:RecB family exonuclease